MPPSGARRGYDVVVIGLGLAGLVAALAAAGRGARTLVVGRGHGTIRFRSGTIDVLGYRAGRAVRSPAAEMPELVAEDAGHPYALAGTDLAAGVDAVLAAASEASLPLQGALDANRLVATAAGTLRPACLVPASMAAEWADARVLAVGVAGYRDFHPGLVAAVLPQAAARQGLDVSCRALTVEVPALRRRHLGGLDLARSLEDAAVRRELADAVLRAGPGDATVVALPAVLGVERAVEVRDDLAARLGVPVVELPTLPPSVPGIRLELALTAALRRAGVVLQVGPEARLPAGDGEVGWVELAAPGHPLRVPAARVVLATGGLASGGLVVTVEDTVREPVAGLPVLVPSGPLYDRAFLAGHPADLAGVRVDASMRPVDGDGAPVRPNLFAAGGLLARADRASEKSADGICCATGWRAGTGAAT